MSAVNVYNFINACLALIKNPSVSLVDTTSLPPFIEDDIKAATTAAVAAGATVAAPAPAPAVTSATNLQSKGNAATPLQVQETLKLILAELGYKEKVANLFIRENGDNFLAVNFATSNAWEINKQPIATPLYGGKKRKTNRRKHRRSNRKTLGRKK
jgi:hypothetical protein